MGYTLGEVLPIYSRGLSNVAGDQLKTASDLGTPIIAVGLLFQRDYFRQKIDSTGAQVALYPFNDPGQLPIHPVRNKAGDWLRLNVSQAGYPFGFVLRKRRSAAESSTCWIQTTQPICPRIGVSRRSFTAEDRSCVCDRKQSSGSAAGACYKVSASGPRSAI
jgi:hypothetical protein